MKGLTLSTNQEKTELIATIDPLIFGPIFDKEAFLDYFENSEFSHFKISADNILQLSDKVDIAASHNDLDTITAKIGELKPIELSVALSKNQMECSLSLESPSNGIVPKVTDVIALLKSNDVVRGISKKRIRQLLQTAIDSKAGTQHKQIVAKGLAPRNGKDSHIVALVPNAIDRVLAPREVSHNKVDMRNFGEILSVKPQQIIAKRLAPSDGRKGFTVTNKIIDAEPGKWREIKLGANTAVSQTNENMIVATLSGQAKFENQCMSVDDTYISKGVNVGTGNIKYDGAVVVNGDVTENMQIIAEGDVTVNGFVESAYIRSGGDIIITQGATGKMNIEDCQLIANGNVFIQHAQGLDVIAGKNVTVAKQLAYSKVKCRGSVTVGNIDKPMGNLFASSISCYKGVRAGSVGAVSGSLLSIDFSEGYNTLIHRSEALSELLSTLSCSNADHEEKLLALKSRHIPASLKQKLANLNNELESERVLLNWLRLAKQELIAQKSAYEVSARIIANKELFPGVMVKLNNKMWKSEKEYQRSRIILENDAWLFDPIV